MRGVIEVSFDQKNRDWYFRPIDRNIRGRFQLARVAEPTAMSFRDRIPDDVPAQVLGIDLDKGVGYLLEPIHDQPPIKKMIERQGMRLEPERQEFAGIEVDAWLFWLKARATAGGLVVLKGQLPETVNYDPPPRFGRQPKRGPARLREIFQKHPDVAATYAGWDANERREWEQLVGV